MSAEAILRLLLVILFSYLIGAIPTAVIVSRKFFGFDIRTKGSGNMGSTNAFRVLGWKWGIFVQIADILKGLAAVILIPRIFFDGVLPFVNSTPFADMTLVEVIAGLTAVIGHIFSVFVGFKGGKGINTAAGMLLGIAPLEFAIAFSFFLFVVGLSGYISLGSIIAALVLPSSMAFRYNILHANIPGYHTLIFFFIALSLLVIYAHRSNIRRLMNGTESKFSKLQIFRKRP